MRTAQHIHHGKKWKILGYNSNILVVAGDLIHIKKVAILCKKILAKNMPQNGAAHQFLHLKLGVWTTTLALSLKLQYNYSPGCKNNITALKLLVIC